ncbi:MAG: hypothetical protein AAGG51_05030 [Cyanobacteria bacterium P01_G01_bin.54]
MEDIDIRVENLHITARRYCLEEYDFWVKEYSRIHQILKFPYQYSDKELDTFPRYHVLKAILDGVEAFIPADFSGLEEAKAILAEVGSTAKNVFTEPPNEMIADQAMLEEREKFIHFIENFPEDDLFRVKPLFYRRVLTQKENDYHWQRLKDIWNLENGCYYPLDLVITEQPVLAFWDVFFEDEFGFDDLRNILRLHEVNRIIGLFESQLGHELEVATFEPIYSSRGEGYWFSEDYDWLVYASHESSITLGGHWLINEVKNVWTNWQEGIWRSSYFE